MGCGGERLSTRKAMLSRQPGYVIEAATLGISKGWIMLGHSISEETGNAGMASGSRDLCRIPVQAGQNRY